MNPDSVPCPVRHPGHEPVASSLRNLFIVAGCVSVMLAVSLACAELFMHACARNRPMQSMQPFGILVAPNNNPLSSAPAPALELDDGHADFIALDRRQNEGLHRYGWIDRSNGIARIPIERAMDMVAARGLPGGVDTVATNSPLRMPK